MGLTDDALRAAQKNDKHRKKTEGERGLAIKQKHVESIEALRDRWDKAASQFFSKVSKQGYAGATVVRLYKGHFWQHRPRYAAWYVWTKDFGSDSRTPPTLYYLLADGQMAYGSSDSISIVGRERKWDHYEGHNDLKAIVSSLEQMASRTLL